MTNEDQINDLLQLNEKLIIYLNKVIGVGRNKIMSQRKLASLLGVSNSTVERWLNEKHPLRMDVAIKICKILNLDIDDFYADLENDYSCLKTKFINLSEENKIKVMEYIDFLSYQQQKTIKK